MTAISRIQSAKPVAKATKSAQATPAKPSSNNGMGGDLFTRSTPSAADIAKAKQTIDALASMPKIPLSNSDKAAWLKDANARLAEAQKADQVLQDAWMGQAISMDDMGKYEDAISNFQDKIESCQERSGEKPLPVPLNPFRPLFQYTKDPASLAGGGVIGGLLAVIVLPAAIVVDTVDAVTRPLQLVAYPFELAWRGMQNAGHKLGVG